MDCQVEVLSITLWYQWKASLDGVNSAMADTTRAGGCGVDNGEDDSKPKIENRRLNIITSTYTSLFLAQHTHYL